MTYSVVFPKRRQERGGTAAALASLNEIPLAREIILATDTGRLKFGDGATAYNSLAYFDADNIPILDTGTYFTATDVEGALQEIGANYALKSYVDAAVAGLSWKQAVRVATTAAGTLATSFENGDTVDGVVLATGDRILIKNQAAPAENGIYTVNASGAPTRATDANSGAELVNASLYVSEGTQADTQWTQTTNAPITLGASNIVFAQLTSGAGIADGDYGDITVSGSGTALTIDAGVVTLAKQANVATATVFYRKTAGAGAPEVQTLATLKTDLGLTGTNSGDQASIVGITGSLAEFNAALTGADFATGGGTVTGASSGTNTGDQSSIVGITGSVAEFNAALTGADFATGGGTATGTNTGDQTSIVGISGTMAQFNTACSDGDFGYLGAANAWTAVNTWNVGGTPPALAGSTVGAFVRASSAAAQASLSIISGNAATVCALNFGDTDDENVGRVSYNHSTNAMTFNTLDTLALTLDASQNAIFAGTLTAVLASATTATTQAAGTNNTTVATTAYADRISPVGKHAVPISAGSMLPSASVGCAPLTRAASAANQPDIVTLDFDPTTQEYAQFSIAMPSGWDEGTVTFQAIWSHAATTTNFGVVWDLQAIALSDDDAIAQNFGTAQTSTDTGGTTNDLYVSPESAAITVAGTPAAKDVVHFRLSRVTGNGSDTMAIDARLHGIVLFITLAAPVDV